MRELTGNGEDDLIVTSETPQNSAARVYTFANFQTGNVNVPTTYPLGTTTIDGIYVG